ncbi:hypothetical protein [Nocardia blacklockiae]|uniref:hypothetical protein n=1 Tax=Nocardia blacklockiae TaxID=480036 RepID=UPI0018934F36|nr:hypothetical protein [Nocardia blacklockiae]MBF6171097.1 hypothetical protein [Nocardia blacklockiae]
MHLTHFSRDESSRIAEALNALYLPQLAQMARCRCPPEKSPGEAFLFDVRRRAIDLVDMFIARGASPLGAFYSREGKLFGIPTSGTGHRADVSESDAWARHCDLHVGPVAIDQGDVGAECITRIAESARLIARNLLYAIALEFDSAFNEAIATDFEARYQQQLTRLRRAGYTARIRHLDEGIVVISVPLGRIGARAVSAELSNAEPGLKRDPDADTEPWTADARDDATDEGLDVTVTRVDLLTALDSLAAALTGPGLTNRTRYWRPVDQRAAVELHPRDAAEPTSYQPSVPGHSAEQE